MNIFYIRPTEYKDLVRIQAIERTSFADPWSKNMFLSELVPRGYNNAWVAVDELRDEVIGYCFFWIIEGDEIHISNIAVDPQERKRGVGREFIHRIALDGIANLYPSITLEVRESNTIARKFYDKLGFREEGRRKNYYEKPKEDAMILRLYLTQDSILSR